MTIPQHRLRRRATSAFAIAAAAGLALAACSTGSGEPAASESQSAEAAEASARLALTTDGGVVVLDAETLEPVGDVPIDGFLRVNPAGDGEHVFVTTSQGFEVLATGATSGDEPSLTGAVFEGDAAGHVVLHDGRTVLFDDATGDYWAFDTDALTDSDALPADMDAYESAAAHHGVAVELADGTLLSTLGDEESRTGVRHLDADGTELARFEECPSVHGEGVAADEHVLFGCQDGVLLFTGGEFQKLDSPDEFGRVGNAYVTDESPIAFVDYRDDPDAEGSLLHRVGMVDTAAGTWEILDLPEGVEYTWQGVERDHHGDAWLIGTDGALHMLDGETGELARSIPAIDAWEGPAEWQDAHPYLLIDDHTAYVTDPASSRIVAVDLESGEIVAEGELDAAPSEMALAG
ncbi:zinc metallochaperone AztD [Agrococcus versicolor]|uniref:Zinc metallochaperone AztD n=1 Tax=Agrococcus versicolor TaxID=501482 RepID=A0ABN3AJA2_9MICO